MQRPYYTSGVGKKMRWDSLTGKRLADEQAANPVPFPAWQYTNLGRSTEHRLSYDVTPMNLAAQLDDEYDPNFDENLEAYQPPSSQLINMSKRSDFLPSAPPKRFKTGVGKDVSKQPSLHMTLVSKLKGIGFIKPGPVLQNKSRILKNQFAFDVVAPIGKREFARTMWRHGKSGYSDTAVDCLSPALRSTTRTVDGVVINTPVRRGHYSDDDVLYSATNLWDLEAASWNANGFKLVSDLGYFSTTVPSANTTNLTVYTDFNPATDHFKGTPFFPQSGTSVYTTQQRPPFLVNLGPGSITVQAQNRLPTDAIVEIVVFQFREQLNSEGTTYFHQIESYVSTTTAAKRKGLLFGDTLSGQAKNSVDPLTDPLHKFMTYYPKYSNRPAPFKLRSREKFLLKGASNKSVTIHLPAQIYSSRHNHNVCGDPFATVPSAHSNINTLTYMIYFAVNGVVMPMFSYPKAQDSNAGSAVDYVNETAVDMQPANADVLFTGEYIERPFPCLSTPQEIIYDNLPELSDVTVQDTTNWALVPGYVSEMPTTVNSGQVTAFGLGQSVKAGGPQG